VVGAGVDNGDERERCGCGWWGVGGGMGCQKGDPNVIGERIGKGRRAGGGAMKKKGREG